MHFRNFTFVLTLTLFTLATSCKNNEQTTTAETSTDSFQPVPADTLAVDTSATPVTQQPGDQKDTAQPSATAKKAVLTVVVENLRSPNAPVVLGFFAPQNKFLDANDQFREYRLKPKNGVFSAQIDDLPFGEYAMAIYQDVDSDGQIDKNGLGIPQEPYAFSNNYKPKLRAPRFDECKFQYNEKSNTVKMALIQ